METKIIVKDENLWNRIQSFSLDVQNVEFPFSKKLAKEENWTENFTKKAIEEYKKFVYLCCILPNGASPSEIVDKVWHMHLIYTQNYWEEFCPNVLKQSLHHQPSHGGSNEKAKHQNWFHETLKHYEEIFDEKAPEEIWLSKKGKPKRRKFWLYSVKIFSVFFIIFLLNSCSNGISNFFSLIVFVPIIFVIVSFISGLFGKNNKDKNKGDDGSSGSCGGGSSSSCSSSSCGSSCGSGCGGCGGGGD